MTKKKETAPQPTELPQSEDESFQTNPPAEISGIAVSTHGGRKRYACGHGCPRAYFEQDLMERAQARCEKCTQRKQER